MSATPTTADAERIAYIERYREEPIPRRVMQPRKPRQHTYVLRIDDLYTHSATEVQQTAIIKYFKDAYNIKAVYGASGNSVNLFSPIRTYYDFKAIASHLDDIFDVKRAGIVPPSYMLIKRNGTIEYNIQYRVY